MQTVIVKPQIKVVQPEGYINVCNAPEFENLLGAAIACPASDCLLVDLGQIQFFTKG